MTVNGHDLSKIYLETLDLAAAGYMKYRTVDVYPQVDQQINIAIQTIASGQMSAKAAMQTRAGAFDRGAQARRIAALRWRSGTRFRARPGARAWRAPGRTGPPGGPRAAGRSPTARLPVGARAGVVVLTLVTVGPMIYLVLTSLTPLNLVHPRTAYDFAHPLANYLGLLHDPDFSTRWWCRSSCRWPPSSCSC